MSEENIRTMKARDLESLVFFGRVVDVNFMWCDDKETRAKVVAKLDTGETVSTECIPKRAAGKISIVMKRYITWSKFIIKDQNIGNVINIDTEGPDEEEEEKK
jgi:hypothetical protein